jgi:hypothetical protein
MNKNVQYMCLWSAPLMGVFMTIGWWLMAEFVPPPSPSWSAVEIADMFTANTTGIRIGMISMLVGVGFFLPFIALLSEQIRRMEGGSSTLAYTQLIAGSMSVAIVLFPIMFWVVASFRPDRNPELVQLLNDMAWLTTAMPFAPGIIQNVAMGIAILGDKNPIRIMPRWVAYMNFWMAALFIPAGLMVFFKTGPFAWNGLLAFWLPLVAFGIWFNVMIFALLKAIKTQTDTQPA